MKNKFFTFYLILISLFILTQDIFCQININMEKEGGVFLVPCKVNGLNLKFIFDTGASDVSISLTEALFMIKNDYLKSSDIIGKEKYSDATGKISVGTTINIRRIDFAGLTLYNVKASIVDNLSAPLLLGQTAMAKLGKFIFDPLEGKLTILNNNELDTISQPKKKLPSTNNTSTTSPNISNQKENADLNYIELIDAKARYLIEIKTNATETASGLKYKIIKAGSGKKPLEGNNVYINYAGYLEDGSLFDSSIENVNKEYGKFDENRAKQNGYQPFPFPYGKKDGLIPGFIEALELMNLGDTALIFIPSKLGYGERGAGNVIPPNTNIIFEIEMLETAPTPKQ
jgi:FKBP-type peptidyl-prolyl cis-trans isomerase